MTTFPAVYLITRKVRTNAGHGEPMGEHLALATVGRSYFAGQPFPAFLDAADAERFRHEVDPHGLYTVTTLEVAVPVPARPAAPPLPTTGDACRRCAGQGQVPLASVYQALPGETTQQTVLCPRCLGTKKEPRR